MQGTRNPLRLSCFIFVFSVLSFWPKATFSQTRHVEVLNQAQREEERTAHHLKMTTDQLRETRRLLREATDLALSEELDSTWRLNGLLNLWRRAHPTETMATMETVLGKLKDTAAHTPDPATYGWALSAARGVVGETFSRAARRDDYLTDWPQRPELGDPASGHLEKAQAESERARWFESAHQDPLEAARNILRGSGPESLALTTHLAGQLRFRGESETALELVESALDRLRNGQYTDGAEVWNFVHQVARIFPDHFPEAVEILHSMPLANSFLGSVGETLLRNDRGEALLTPEESRLLQLLRGTRFNPALLDQVVRRFPDFNAKLAKMGGVEKALRAEVTSWSKDGETRTWDPTQYDRQRFVYGWGEATLNPGQTRRRLQSAFPDEEDLPVFFYTVRQHCAEDPDFSRIALGLLSDRVFQIEEAERRIGRLSELFPVVYQCESQVDAALLERGFGELEAFRKTLPPAAGDSPGKSSFPVVNRLEEVLLAALSRADFDGAIQRIRAVDPPSERLRLLLAMVRSRLDRY